MLKSFFKGALIYTLPAILSRGIGIFLLPIYTRIASPDELGTLDLFLAFGNLVALTIALEISQGIARYIPEISDLKIRKEYSSTGLYFTFFIYVFFSLVAFTFYVELSQLITGKNEYAKFFQLALVYIFLNGFFYYFQNQLRFEEMSVGYAIVSVVYATLNFVSALFFGLVYDLGLSAILYSMIVSSLLSSLLGLYFLRRSFGLVFHLDLLRQLLRFSIPLMPSSILVFVSLYVDRYMINLMVGLDGVGQYGIAVRLASAAGLVLIGFQMAITPLIYKHHNETDTPKYIALLFKYFTIFAVTFFLTYSLFIQDLLVLLTTPDFYMAADAIPLLILALFFSNIYVFMPGIAIRKKTYLILLISLFAAIVNIALNFLLIPALGIVGASLATAVGYFFALLGFIIFSQKLYYVPHKWFSLVLIFGVASVFVFLNFMFFLESDYLNKLFFRLFAILIFIISMFSLKIITMQELFNIKNLVLRKV
jgi:O-antigen/teichoic acid export membrane protein